MKSLWKVNLVVVTLLGVAAALPKIMQVPQEAEFFRNVGLGGTALVVFGLAQLVGGVLLIFQRTRKPGAVVVTAMFLGSAVMVFAAGQIGFGLISLLPALMAATLTRQSPDATL